MEKQIVGILQTGDQQDALFILQSNLNKLLMTLENNKSEYDIRVYCAMSISEEYQLLACS